MIETQSPLAQGTKMTKPLVRLRKYADGRQMKPVAGKERVEMIF